MSFLFRLYCAAVNSVRNLSAGESSPAQDQLEYMLKKNGISWGYLNWPLNSTKKTFPRVLKENNQLIDRTRNDIEEYLRIPENKTKSPEQKRAEIRNKLISAFV